MLLLFSCGTKENADLLLIRGNIVTLNEKSPKAEAVAIRGGKIIDVGTGDALKKKYVATRIEDLHGATVLPGLIDAHLHIMGLGRSLMELNVIGVTRSDEIVSMVAQKTKTAAKGKWIKGRGWDQNLWASKEFPTGSQLDAVSPDHYVILTRVDGHAVWVNRKVMDAAGISKNTKDPDGGKIIRDSSGNPSGVLIDNAKGLIYKIIPVPTYAEDSLALETAMDACAKFGLTSVHDAGVGMETIKLYKDFAKRGDLKLRIYAMLDGTQSSLLESYSKIGPEKLLDGYFKNGPEKNLYNDFLTIASVKLYADGALGSRGAALLEPYSDNPKNYGLELTSKNEIEKIAEQSLKHGFQVCIHAIGDRGNRNALDAYEEALAKTNSIGSQKRLRIEHGQIVNENDIPRFAALGVIASMQPTHCTSDMYWAESRLGPKRILGAYAWKKLTDSGVTVAFGSDAPVESCNPLWGIYAAVTRQDQKGFPDGGFYPDQRMTLMEALQGFTIHAAYAAFEENDKGTIEAGKLADLVVLSNDLTAIEPQEILTTEVKLTIVNGRIVYRSKN